MTFKTALSVNVNKIALLRNARGGWIPDLRQCAATIVAAGADGITVHPRPDLRHILPEDVVMLAELAKEKGVEFNIEGNPAASMGANGYPGFNALVEQATPDQCTLVPDAVNQLTSDHGWDLSTPVVRKRVRDAAKALRTRGVRVSLFMDPDVEQILRAADLGVDRIELFTGPYAEAFRINGAGAASTQEWLDRHAEAAATAISAGVGVNAGHDLDLSNLAAFCRTGRISEVSIGQALVADALEFGLARAVGKYQALLRSCDEVSA